MVSQLIIGTRFVIITYLILPVFSKFPEQNPASYSYATCNSHGAWTAAEPATPARFYKPSPKPVWMIEQCQHSSLQ